jgi:hypothetical protein
MACRCFEDRLVNLAPRCSRKSMVALETRRIIMVQEKALRPVSEGFKFVFLGSSDPKAYNGGFGS